MTGLIYNEISKVVAQRRFIVVLVIMTLLSILIALITHGINSIKHLGYTSAHTVTGLISESAQLLFPFLFAIIIGDIFAGEQSGGTMKLLLIRPVSRWKIWVSKFVGAYLVSIVIVLYYALCCYVSLGAAIGFGSFSAAQGSQMVPGQSPFGQMVYISATSGAVLIHTLALEAASIFCIVSLFLLISTLTETGIAAVGLCASLTVVFSITDGIMSKVFQLAPKSHWFEYAFFEHWGISAFATYTFDIDKWTQYGSLGVLGVWSALFIVAGMVIFWRKDIKG